MKSAVPGKDRLNWLQWLPSGRFLNSVLVLFSTFYVLTQIYCLIFKYYVLKVYFHQAGNNISTLVVFYWDCLPLCLSSIEVVVLMFSMYIRVSTKSPFWARILLLCRELGLDPNIHQNKFQTMSNIVGWPSIFRNTKEIPKNTKENVDRFCFGHTFLTISSINLIPWQVIYIFLTLSKNTRLGHIAKFNWAELSLNVHFSSHPTDR